MTTIRVNEVDDDANAVEDEAFVWLREGRWQSIQLRQNKQIKWQMPYLLHIQAERSKTTQYALRVLYGQLSLLAKRNQQQQSHAASVINTTTALDLISNEMWSNKLEPKMKLAWLLHSLCVLYGVYLL